MQTELFNMGLVTARIPSLLRPGELVRCDNLIYTYDSQSIGRAPGRTLLANGGAGTAVRGLTSARFSNGNVFLVFSQGTKYRISGSGPNSTFADLKTGLTGSDILTSVKRGDLYFIFNGVDRNQVLRKDGTLRDHGLNNLTITPEATVGSGTWSYAIGWYQYWTTEVVSIAENGGTTTLECAFTGTPKLVYIPNASSTVTITRPPLANNNATRWRLYRSPCLGASPYPGQFPIGSQVGNDIDILQAKATDGVGTGTGYRDPTHQSGTNGGPSSALTLPASALFADGGNYATMGALAVQDYSQVIADQYGFSSIGSPVYGVEAVIRCRLDTSDANMANWAQVQACLVSDSAAVNDGNPWGGSQVFISGWRTVPASVNAGFVDVLVGGAGDMWPAGQGDVAGDKIQLTKQVVEAANFGVCVKLTTAKGLYAATLYVDHIKIKIYHQGTTDVSQPKAYDALQLVINGVETADHSHSAPPISEVGCLCGDMLVVNDVANPSFVRWSLAGFHDYFPGEYYYPFALGSTGVVNIGAIGDKVVVGLSDQIVRMNYLPTEDDAIFSRGNAIDPISPTIGCISKRGMVSFSGADGRSELAFVSRQGLFATDGYTIRSLTQDLKWKAMTYAANLSKAILVNNPDNWELILYYSDVVGGVNKKLHFNYHPQHLKEGGMLKVSGPVIATTGTPNYTTAVCTAWKTDGTLAVYTGLDNGDIYYDDPTAKIVADGAGSSVRLPVLQTREMYLAGFGMQSLVSDWYIHFSITSPIVTLSITPSTFKTGKGVQSHSAKTVAASFTGQAKVVFNQTADAIQFVITESTDTGNMFTIDRATINASEGSQENA